MKGLSRRLEKTESLIESIGHRNVEAGREYIEAEQTESLPIIPWSLAVAFMGGTLLLKHNKVLKFLNFMSKYEML